MPASSSKIGVLVAQLGTPQAPTARALRPYLRQFLSDPRVIDLHPLRWYPILYLFVLTRRPARSAVLYANIWTDEGSPLMVHSQAQTRGLQERLGEAYRVVLGMRYGEPSIERAVQSLESEGIERILVFPMFPQFSCATTGSIYDAVNRAALGRRCPWFFARKRQMPALRFVPPYADHPAYINALKQSVAAAVARLSWTPDRYLITFHGIPQRYVDEGDPYRRHCEETARQLATALGLADDEWVSGFQSRFGKEPWLEPYTEDVLERLGGQGVRRLVAICPGFTSDCLETLDEIGREGAEQFAHGGGQQFHLVPCLNDHPAWLDAMATIARRELAGWNT
ncbi:MAG: ferrochelatase [Gemmatimonadetes bacterium]|nr:ferrochelatase [Gemmatimonadota bacterium]MYC69827.1 ferrochelatase [Gemmatimonadota bacterium]MYI62111.1 ferrochelatase [Gemmatimonadota bacterium]